LNISNVYFVNEYVHHVLYNVPNVRIFKTKIVTTVTRVVTESSTEIMSKKSETTDYTLIFVSLATIFLAGTIPLYIIIGRKVRNISRLKKQRPSNQRVKTDMDMIIRLDNIEGQMTDCKRLIEKSLKRD
jgi:hypothetical protein